MSETNKRQVDNNKKKKKKRNKFFIVLKIMIMLFLIVGFIGAGACAGLVFAAIKDLEPIDPSKINQLLDENSVILDSEGNVIEQIQKSGLRTLVKYEEIDEDLKNAFIATEDRTFFEHHGFNFKRLIGAVLQGIKNRAPIKGTSTITQQLARNLYLPHIKSERSLTRKIKEAYYAIQLERYLTKEQIFEAYMNTIYLGSGAKGVQAAAQVYFSKDAKDLDLVESALIAGITQNPSKHSPLKTLKKEDVDEDDYILDDSDEIYTIVFNEKCLDRYQDVLYFMKINGYISEKEYEEALNVDLKTKLKPGKNVESNISSYFTDLVKKEVLEALMMELGISQEEAEDMLYTQGLKIYSTIDVNLQKTVEQVFQETKNFPDLVSRKDKSGNILSKTGNNILLYKIDNIINSEGYLVIPKGDYRYNDNGDLVLLKGKRLNFVNLYEGNKIVGIRVVIKDTYSINEKGQFTIYKGGTVQIPSEYKEYDDNNNLIVKKEFLNSSNFFKKDAGDNLLVGKEHYTISNQGIVQPQASMVIIDHTTGEIKALVGGREIRGQKLYNRAINPRQPGSAIKPIAVYTAALDNGWTPASVVDDVPFYDANGNRWPKNWYEKASNPQETGYWGLTTIREAIQWSMNVPAVKVAQMIGISTSIEYMKKMGISTVVEEGPRNDLNLSAVGLGGMTKGVTPLELAGAYATLANQGIYIKPHTFTKITDRNGNVILENKAIKNYVVSPQIAFLMTDMLRTGVQAGTGTRARLENMPVAGKTGTTSDNYDAWFVGFTPYYTGALWIGNDLQIELDSGSSVSATLWKEVMAKVHENLPKQDFVKPDGIVRIAVDSKSGKLPTQLSYLDQRGSTVINEYFVAGTEPKDYDDVHVEVEVCVESNKLPTEYCPITSIEKRVFVNRPIPYYPEEHGGFIPRDYPYEVPRSYCDIHSRSNSYNNYDYNNLPIGSVVLPDGTIQLPDGRKIFPDGTILFPDGTIIYPSRENSSGEYENNNGRNRSNNGIDDIVDSTLDDLIDSTN